jgi:hypothetical protein
MEGPGLECIGLLGPVGREKGRPSAVNEEYPEVAVAPLRDGSEPSGTPRGGLAGREAEIGGEATAGGEPVDVTDGGNEGGGREDADARDGHEKRDPWDEGGELFKLALEIVSLGLEFLDLGEGLGKGSPEIGGKRVIIEGEVGLGQEGASAQRHGDAELSQETTDRVDTGGAGAEIAGAKAVQRIDGLLIEGFDGDWSDILITSGLEEGFGIGSVGFVALAVASHVGGREQRDLMAKGLELASPVMSRATGFHKDVGRRMVQEEVPEPLAREPMLLIDATGGMGDGDLKDGLCEIHGDLGSIHEGFSPRVWPSGPLALVLARWCRLGEESIPSVPAAALECAGAQEPLA